MNPLQAFLHLLADPNIAFILFTLGFYGLLFELQNPNFVTGILGASRSSSPSSASAACRSTSRGLLLIGLAIVLFVLELTVTSHGLLAIGGLVASCWARPRCTPSRARRPRPTCQVAHARSSWP